MPKLHLAIAAACLLIASESSAQLADPLQAHQVCSNWLSYTVETEGNWAGTENPKITKTDEVFYNNTLLGYCFQIEPSGYVLVPTFMQLAPIKATSCTSSFDVQAEGGFSLLVRENLYDRYNRFSTQYGDPAAVPSSTNLILPLAFENRQAWEKLLVNDTGFQSNLSTWNKNEGSKTGPLLSTAWHQGTPYNDFCPMGDDGDLCIVGCVATAIAQVLVYHGSPNTGTGHHQYLWSGDGTCGGMPRSSTLVADFSDSYEFDLMPEECSVNDQPRVKDAVAELCYEVGVSVNMNYGVCWSGSNTNLAQTVLPQYFRYQDEIQLADRSHFDNRSWFFLIQTDIDRSQPLLYSFTLDSGGGHAVVCDGWRNESGIDQIHLNYGWGGSHTAWYALDDIYESADPGQESIVYNIQPGPPESSGTDDVNIPSQQVAISSSPNPFNPRTTIQ
ncbi:MAG: hypothetical protein GY780_05020, partial [bacterium]|nr:hypothetical protein [bacterium]